MSDINEPPRDDEMTYAEGREKQAEFEGLVEEKDGDVQAATDAQLAGEEPDDEDRTNYKLT
ncbi:hypothetical protein [Actinomarinicola tropica]|uniref:Uncharacterized protein n=1 Tax=Actinomarinicola tropica TaxID=2789776 RepID=A0A5Q2RGG9_9ACTN|nr:hypothetical protein [Actinomarinicola tropica]QGG93902.1 hypothetical protein GH723_01560 [Actinomarinicola tropica]